MAGAAHESVCWHDGALGMRGAHVCWDPQYYDRCIAAIQEDPASVASTWDC